MRHSSEVQCSGPTKSSLSDQDLLSGGRWVESGLSVNQSSKLLVTISDEIKPLRHASVCLLPCPVQNCCFVDWQTSYSANVVFYDWNILSSSHYSTHLKASLECKVFLAWSKTTSMSPAHPPPTPPVTISFPGSSLPPSPVCSLLDLSCVTCKKLRKPKPLCPHLSVLCLSV